MHKEQSSKLDNVDQRALLVLRLAIGSLLFAPAVRNFQGGTETIQKTVRFFQTAFENTWLPVKLVIIHAYATPFIEALIVIWLISGCRLTAAWVFTALFTTSLAFGMSVAGRFDTAADNYTYVLICCAGLLLSRYDRLRVDALWNRSPGPPLQ